MFDDREPIEEGTSRYVQVHHEDITPADASLFRKSIPFSGPNAVTWIDALSQISTLISCNEEYARFDQDPANLKNWKYPPSPLAESSQVSVRTEAELVPAHGLGRLTDLPREVREEVWLATVEPRILGAQVRVCDDDVTGPRIVMIIGDSNFRHCGTSKESNQIKNPGWDDIKLYSLGPEARDLAIREYGQPSTHSVPFRPAIDELLLDVGLDEDPHIGGWPPVYECYHTKGDLRVAAFRNMRTFCQFCISNRAVLDDPDLLAVFATDEECPDPRPEWLQRLRCGPETRIPRILTHPVYRPASAELLDRFRKVTLRIKKSQDLRIVDDMMYGTIEDAYNSLGDILPRALPRLETLTIRLDPMRDYRIALNRTEYDANLGNLYDGRRIMLLDGLTAAGNEKHDLGCNRGVPCNCQLLPFDHMKRLVVKVSTKKTFGFIRGGRRPVQEWFTDRPPGSLFVCPKGVAPLSRNGWRHPMSDRIRDFTEERLYFYDPRDLTKFSLEDPEPQLLAILNRPDSPEP